MRIFISAGEPSGDLHGANLIRAIRRIDPSAQVEGFGGPRMEQAGARLLYPLCQLAVMGLWPVLVRLPAFLRVLVLADRYFRDHRPDAVVLIDFPGLHWWLARRAKARGIPVFYFVPPQLWAWAGWRVRRMKRYVDHVLCTLPFEEDWYQQRGVNAHYVGHPYFDELGKQSLDSGFVQRHRQASGRIVGLLPGSRTQEVHRNFPTMVRAAELILQQYPETLFLVACFRDRHFRWVQQQLADCQLPIEPCLHRTPEIIHLSDACIAVSGSVSLELLFRLKPAAIVYRIRKVHKWLGRLLLTCKFITLVNLLADRIVYPEYVSERCEAEAISRDIVRWLSDEEARGKTLRQLQALRSEECRPGACDRAAAYLAEALSENRRYEAPAA